MYIFLYSFSTLSYSYSFVGYNITNTLIMLNAVVPLSLGIMGVVIKNWVWLAKFPQTESPLKNPAYAPGPVLYKSYETIRMGQKP